MLFDAIENINIIAVLGNPSNPNPPSAMLTSVSATLEFGLLLLSALFMVFLLLMLPSKKGAGTLDSSTQNPRTVQMNSTGHS
jgi:hypothetical protein